MLFNTLPKTVSSAVLVNSVRRLSHSSYNNRHVQKAIASVAVYGLATLGVTNFVEKNNKGYLFRQLGN